MVPAQRLISSEDQKLEKGGTKSFGGKVLASLIDKLITIQPSYIKLCIQSSERFLFYSILLLASYRKVDKSQHST